MARRTREEALATREQLLDAAERVFRERGVGHTTLAEVADAAGVTRGAVYWHFRSKADLFEAMVARAEMPHETSLQRMEDAAAEDPMAALRQGAIDSLTHLMTDARARAVYEIVFLRCEYTDELATVRHGQACARDNCYDKIVTAMRAAVERGQLPAGTDIKLAARGIYAYVSGLMRDYLDAPDTIDPREDAGALIDIYLEGLRAGAAVRKKRNVANRKPATPRRATARRKGNGSSTRATAK